MNNMLRAYDSALAFFAFVREYPEVDYLYRKFYRQDFATEIIQTLDQFKIDHEPTPIVDTLERVYRKLRYLAAPGGNWN